MNGLQIFFIRIYSVPRFLLFARNYIVSTKKSTVKNPALKHLNVDRSQFIYLNFIARRDFFPIIGR